jgi:hypothetical protein
MLFFDGICYKCNKITIMSSQFNSTTCLEMRIKYSASLDNLTSCNLVIRCKLRGSRIEEYWATCCSSSYYYYYYVLS